MGNSRISDVPDESFRVGTLYRYQWFNNNLHLFRDDLQYERISELKNGR